MILLKEKQEKNKKYDVFGLYKLSRGAADMSALTVTLAGELARGGWVLRECNSECVSENE